MNLPLFIAQRLSLKAEGKQKKSPGVVIAIAGVTVAVAVMLMTMAVVTGFKKAIREKVSGFDSQISVTSLDGENRLLPFSVGKPLTDIVTQTLGEGVEISGSLTTTGVLKTDNDFTGITFRSETPGTKTWDFIAEAIIEGEMPDFNSKEHKNSIVVSASTANLMNLKLGDPIFAYFFSGGDIKTRRVNVAAIYDTAFGERDKFLSFVAPQFLESVLDVQPSMVSRMEINGLEFDNIPASRNKLQEEFNRQLYSSAAESYFSVDDVTKTGAIYFNWLELIDTNVIVILILMAVVGGFTLVSSLFILILERVNMIGTLKSIGMADNSVSHIFLWLAFRLVGAGLILGNIIGLTLIFLQLRFHIIPLDPAAYYLSFVPVSVDWISIVLVNIGAIIISWLVLILPATLISRISPAETMRYD